MLQGLWKWEIIGRLPSALQVQFVQEFTPRHRRHPTSSSIGELDSNTMSAPSPTVKKVSIKPEGTLLPSRSCRRRPYWRSSRFCAPHACFADTRHSALEFHQQISADYISRSFDINIVSQTYRYVVVALVSPHVSATRRSDTIVQTPNAYPRSINLMTKRWQ